MKKKLIVMASTFPRWKNDTNPPFVYELSKRLISDFDVTVLAPNYPGAKRYEEMDKMKVYRFRYFFSPFEKLAGSGGILPILKKNPLYYITVPFFVLGEYLALRRLVKKIKPDVIHAHWIIPQGLVASLVGVPFVVTTHGGDIFGLQGAFPTMLKKYTLRRAKRITVVSNAIKKEIHDKIDSKLKMEVIPMGVDTKLFNPNKYDASIKKKYGIKGPFLLFVGRLSEKKGVKYLIEAMPGVVNKSPKTKLLIVGGGELEKELKDLSSKLSMDKNIIFTGPIVNKDLPKYYATADIFIAPSIITKEGDREGMPVSIMEAMASGMINVISDNIGNTDIVLENKTGFLIKEKDSKLITIKLISILNKSNLKKIKNLARIKAINYFDWNIIKNQTKEVLHC